MTISLIIFFGQLVFFSLHGFLSWCVGSYICINLLNPFMKSFHLKKYPSFEYNLHLDPFKDTHFYTVLTWRFRWSVFRFCRRYLQHTPGPPPMWRRSLWGWIQGECPGGPSRLPWHSHRNPWAIHNKTTRSIQLPWRSFRAIFSENVQSNTPYCKIFFSNNTGNWFPFTLFASYSTVRGQTSKWLLLNIVWNKN